MTITSRKPRARPTWRTAAAIACLLVSSLAIALLLPTATTFGLMWVACKTDCSALGWHAITYAPVVSAAFAAAGMSYLGMRAFRKHQAITPVAQQRTLRYAYAAGAVVGLIVLAATPHLPVAEKPILNMTSRIAQQI